MVPYVSTFSTTLSPRRNAKKIFDLFDITYQVEISLLPQTFRPMRSPERMRTTHQSQRTATLTTLELYSTNSHTWTSPPRNPLISKIILYAKKRSVPSASPFKRTCTARRTDSTGARWTSLIRVVRAFGPRSIRPRRRRRLSRPRRPRPPACPSHPPSSCRPPRRT